MSSKVSPDQGEHDQLLMDAEEMMDKYLANTSYYRQTVLSASTALHSVWKKQVFANGAEQTKDKLKSFWVNIGLVSALLIGVSYSSATTPITSEDENMASAVSVATVFAGVSLIFSLTVIVVAVIYMIEIDNCTTERDLKDFIHANASFVDGLTGIFSGSVVCLLVSAVATMYITYGRTEFIVVAATAGVITLIGVVFASIVAGHNRFRLWVRYSSPEGKALIANVKRDEMEKLEKLKRDLIFQVTNLRELKDLMELQEVKEKIMEQRKWKEGA